jgi:hypothetical protein
LERLSGLAVGLESGTAGIVIDADNHGLYSVYFGSGRQPAGDSKGSTGFATSFLHFPLRAAAQIRPSLRNQMTIRETQFLLEPANP